MRWTIGDVFTIFSLIIGTPVALRMLWRGYGPHVHRALDAWFPVKDYADRPRDPMSRDDADDDRNTASSLRTDDARTDDGRPAPPAVVTYDRQQLLTAYTYLRSLGAKRDEARAFLKIFSAPLSNDLWAQAAPPPPPDDDATVTPIAGRRTNAVFYPDDPSMEYQPLDEHRR